MYKHSSRLVALLCAVASGSIAEARGTRLVLPTPAIESRAEIRATEGGFAIYTLPLSLDIHPSPVAVSVGSSVRIDKAILVQPKLPARNAVQ
ncbi:hypothetical protein Sj15T_10510 [Sphingobium sp. TA15]|uniref:Uncharacterized protein n=2 Tax=Sphingomonadaceae TaxID=41297 RepID=D4Z8X0_SPHIU|nr:hypothetical protein SJA_P1-01000 [Sphingobium indicum UT26S]BDD66030.1 hypothetical protein Sj15T_10510 [Sphingobium sp. TA15]